MGTTLTGTTPQDTYDSLIKVTDNGPLSGSLKTLTDGLGNDSALALSTGAASITGTLTTSSITRAERLQVGTALDLNTPAGTGNTLQFANYSPSAFVTGSADSYIYKNSTVFGGLAAQSLVFQTRSDTTGGGFAFVAGGTPAVVATITGAGNVGIGTSSPIGKLHVEGVASGQAIRLNHSASNSFIYSTIANANAIAFDNTSGALAIWTGGAERLRVLSTGGLTFNGDTAAANALDDYEEGTWTPTVVANTGSGSPTYSTQLGTYTKIGRQVTVVLTLIFQKNTMSGGYVIVSGLPFTPAANLYSQGAVLIDNLATALSNPILQVQEGQTFLVMLQDNGATGSHAGMSVDTYLGAGSMTLRASATYFV